MKETKIKDVIKSFYVELEALKRTWINHLYKLMKKYKRSFETSYVHEKT